MQAVRVAGVLLALVLLCGARTVGSVPFLPACRGKGSPCRISDFAIDLVGNKSMPMSLKGQADQKNNRRDVVQGFFLPFLFQFNKCDSLKLEGR